MLKTISIKNYILIEDIKIDFDNCFSVMTGETGAGKSILIDALSLILGKRVDASVLFDKQKKCIIEAYFDLAHINLNNFFEENDIDYEQVTIVRREIGSNGKSRAFINDTPVNLSAIKQFTDNLIDLHSQHQNFELNNYKYRLGLIDSIAGTINLYSDYIKEFEKLSEFKRKLNEYSEKLKTANTETDYFKFQIEQIGVLEINNVNELKELEQESSMLENAEEIKTELQKSVHILSEDENSVEANLKTVRASLNSIESSYKNAGDIIKRLESVIIEIRDIADEMNNDENATEINPSLLEKTNQRIDAINTLLKKHNCTGINELLKVYESYKNRISSTEDLEEKVNEYIKQTGIQEKKIIELAQNLSLNRQKSFKTIEESIVSTLKELGMPNSGFAVENKISDEPGLTGFDNLEFLFSANKNMDLQSLEKVASGGELSRLMLTVKSMLAKGLNLPSIIFDEIDTGVSGEIADKMAVIMQSIAKERQVISITHLPQVAAKGQAHFKVIKDETGEKTKISVKSLTSDERILEIASMISGAKTSPQAVENAKILLSVNK